MFVSGGNDDDKFSMDIEEGSVVIAGRLDWETCAQFNLTIHATDATHIASTTVSNFIWNSGRGTFQNNHTEFWHFWDPQYKIMILNGISILNQSKYVNVFIAYFQNLHDIIRFGMKNSKPKA